MRTKRGRALLLPAVLAFAAGPAAGQDPATHLLVVTGLSGEARFAQSYAAWGAALMETATSAWGLPAANAVWLAETDDVHAAVTDRSTKDNLERELRGLASRAGPQDRVLILLFGHGSYQDGATRLNLPGPDIDGAGLAELIAPLETQQVAVVNAASASGGFIQDLAAPNRIIITATKSGMEQNETIFGGHFTAALTGTGADANQDGRVSLLEAFDYTRREVAREYERGNKLLTEHAVIDAIGAGAGVSELAVDEPHGRMAGTFVLGRAGGAVAADASPELRALYDARDRLHTQLDALRARQSSMPAAEYEAALEALLLEIALNAQAIRRLEGDGS